MSSPRSPRILAGRYRLGDVIGRGGMSTVYRATDLSLDRVVAVKVALDPLAEENPVYVARFKREARAAAALDHPGVVTIFDAGSDGPTRYIVMECVDGRSLSDILRDEGRLEPRRAAHIGQQVANTLAAAHAAGIVHRDIKPGNIMVTANDDVKVLDFGIARTADAVTLTQTASILGTAPYMAPEQAMGNPADARSDIYSLGCVLYEMLTGQPPFMADVPAAVLHQHVRMPVKPPGERNPEVPRALDALVVQMLAKNPEDRPQTAAEVRDRLAAIATGSATAPTRPIAPVEAAAAAAAAPEPDPTPAVPEPAFDPAPATIPPPATAPPPAGVPELADDAAPATIPPPATAPPPTGVPAPATAATRALPPTPPPSRRRGPGVWVALAAIAVVLLGAAVAFAVAGGGSTTANSTASQGTTGSHASSHATTPATSPTTTPPHRTSTSTSTSTPTTSTSTTSATTTTTSSTPATTSSVPTTTVTPPGQGGTPPGQAKQGSTQ